MKRLFAAVLVCVLMAPQAKADTVKWVDFQVPYESLKYAMEQDIATSEQEKHIPWIDVLALAGARTGGRCGLSSVKRAVKELKGDQSPEELLGELYRYYGYYHQVYEAVLGGLLGNYGILLTGCQWRWHRRYDSWKRRECERHLDNERWKNCRTRWKLGAGLPL